MQAKAGLRINDETWVPIKWIYTLVASCVVSLATIIGAVWYVAAFAFKADSAMAAIHDTNSRIDLIQGDREDWAKYLRNIDQRLSRIEGSLQIKGHVDEK